MIRADRDTFLEAVDISLCDTGLAGLGLLEPEWVSEPVNPPAEFDFGMKGQPSAPGMELYGWALGVASLQPTDFHLAT